MGGVGKKKVPEYHFSRRRGLVKVPELIDVMKFLAKVLGFKITVDGLDIQEIHDGLHLKATGGGESAVQNFIVTASSDGSGGYNFTVTPGTFMGQPVTLGGVELNLTSPPVGVLGSGEKRVYLKATFSVTTTDDYVNAAELDSAIIEVQSAAVADPLGPRGPGGTIEFYVELAWFVNGVKQAQHISTSLGAEVCGIANDSGQANLEVFRS